MDSWLEHNALSYSEREVMQNPVEVTVASFMESLALDHDSGF